MMGTATEKDKQERDFSVFNAGLSIPLHTNTKHFSYGFLELF